MIRTTATINERNPLHWMLLATLLLLVLGGCDTTGTGTAVECGAFRRLSYSAKGDTAPTIKGIRVHNKTMDNLRCPR